MKPASTDKYDLDWSRKCNKCKDNGVDADSVKQKQKTVEMTTSMVVATKITRAHLGDNPNDGLMVNTITRGLVVTPRLKTTKIH